MYIMETFMLKNSRTDFICYPKQDGTKVEEDWNHIPYPEGILTAVCEKWIHGKSYRC